MPSIKDGSSINNPKIMNLNKVADAEGNQKNK